MHLSISQPESSHLSNPVDFLRTGAAEDFMRNLEHLSKPLNLGPERVLCREGDQPRRFYLLKSGQAVFTVHSDGEVVPCFAVGAGSMIGLSAILAHTPFALTATVSPEAEVRQIDAQEFLTLIENRPDRYMCVLRILAEETHRAHQALAELLAS